MKERFSIIVSSEHGIIHSGIITVETPEQLASHLRKIANTIADLDFNVLSQQGKVPRPAITNSNSSA